ncbi:hypothetical protein MOW12_05435 [Acinetobacter indicus]|nr:hypothetical protein [Acinetobacter indicus]UNW05272.1 hypothetical protein MOW12_05435 [Acinetobacter indicus]
MKKIGYSSLALSKISKLVLADYQISLGVHSPHRTFFVRNISMRSHLMARLERDIFICAGDLVSLSANPFQLCHQLLGSKWQSSFNSLGAHSHA